LASDTKIILIALTIFSLCVAVGFGLTFVSIDRRLADFRDKLDKYAKPFSDEGRRIPKTIEDLSGKVENYNSTLSQLKFTSDNNTRLLKELNDQHSKAEKKRVDERQNSWPPGPASEHRDSRKATETASREDEISKKREEQLLHREQAVKAREDNAAAVEDRQKVERESFEDKKWQVDRREIEAKSLEERSAAELAKAEERMRAAEAKERETEKTRQEIINSENKIAEHRRALQVWQSEFWPAAFQDNGPLARQREDLEHKTVDGDPSAALLCLSLARCRVLIKQAVSGSQTDLAELAQSLHDISRLAYLYWRQGGSSPEQQLEFAREWAKAIEADLDNRLTIRIAEIGAVKNQSWMNYSLGGPVTGVYSWGVLNNRNIALQKASVA
jgi:DNA repair exonuclease SbcCD ATPase subunit